MKLIKAHACLPLLVALGLALAACGRSVPEPAPISLSEPAGAVVLRIAVGPVGPEQLSQWIALYQQARPSTQVRVQSTSAEQAQALLASGALDLALLDEQPIAFYRGVLTATRVAAELVATPATVHVTASTRALVPASDPVIQGQTAAQSTCN